MTEYYVGQIFKGMYPPEAAEWCNSQTDKVITIDELDPVDDERRFQIVDKTPSAEEQAEQEKDRIARLYLTVADVERAIYKAKGMDFDDIITLVETQAPEGLDIKALKIELKANNFYRGNPYIDTIGTLLGFTSEQLDKFFETNDYNELITEDEESSTNT